MFYTWYEDVMYSCNYAVQMAELYSSSIAPPIDNILNKSWSLRSILPHATSYCVTLLFLVKSPSTLISSPVLFSWKCYVSESTCVTVPTFFVHTKPIKIKLVNRG